MTAITATLLTTPLSTILIRLGLVLGLGLGLAVMIRFLGQLQNLLERLTFMHFHRLLDVGQPRVLAAATTTTTTGGLGPGVPPVGAGGVLAEGLMVWY